mgnify:CR=1 FL=1
MGYVDCEQEGHVGIVTINRPKALNALNEEVLKDLETVFDAIDQETVRAVILTGAGEKSFVAGADIAAMSTMTKRRERPSENFGNDILPQDRDLPDSGDCSGERFRAGRRQRAFLKLRHPHLL